jgi:hypothetical protein
MKRQMLFVVIDLILLICIAKGKCGVAQEELADVEHSTSYYCAAVAVQLVLEEFKNKESVVDLNKLLTQDGASPASMFDIKRTLESRGVSVIATYIKHNARIGRDVCAIVHLPNVSKVGHFAVVLPNTYEPHTRTYEIAMNIGHSMRARIDEIDASPEMLLASNEHVGHNHIAASKAIFDIGVIAIGCLSIAASAIWVSVFRKRRHKCSGLFYPFLH